MRAQDTTHLHSNMTKWTHRADRKVNRHNTGVPDRRTGSPMALYRREMSLMKLVLPARPFWLRRSPNAFLNNPKSLSSDMVGWVTAQYCLKFSAVIFDFHRASVRTIWPALAPFFLNLSLMRPGTLMDISNAIFEVWICLGKMFWWATMLVTVVMCMRDALEPKIEFSLRHHSDWVINV